MEHQASGAKARIWELLGAEYCDRVRLHLLMGGDSPQEITAAAREAVHSVWIAFDAIFIAGQEAEEDHNLSRPQRMLGCQPHSRWCVSGD